MNKLKYFYIYIIMSTVSSELLAKDGNKMETLNLSQQIENTTNQSRQTRSRLYDLLSTYRSASSDSERALALAYLESFGEELSRNVHAIRLLSEYRAIMDNINSTNPNR